MNASGPPIARTSPFLKSVTKALPSLQDVSTINITASTVPHVHPPGATRNRTSAQSVTGADPLAAICRSTSKDAAKAMAAESAIAAPIGSQIRSIEAQPTGRTPEIRGEGPYASPRIGGKLLALRLCDHEKLNCRDVNRDAKYCGAAWYIVVGFVTLVIA